MTGYYFTINNILGKNHGSFQINYCKSTSERYMISSMSTIDITTAFLGWCTIINIAILSLSSILLMVWKGKISTLHSRLFGVGQDNLKMLYIQYLANYKIAIIMFNITPYFALKLM
jgi:hypothetical protein